MPRSTKLNAVSELWYLNTACENMNLIKTLIAYCNGIALLTTICGTITAQCTSNVTSHTNYYISGPIHKNFFSTTTKAASYLYNEEIGHLYYERLPLSIFVIHTFFIKPIHRNKGHGTRLLEMACNEIKNKGARMIFIQPGPFEQVDQEFRAVTRDKLKKIELLIKLYTKVGFKSAPRVLRYFAAYVYKLVGLQEDAHYLMIQ